MTEIQKKIIEKAGTLKSEFKKQVSTAIMAAFGLIIALSWKDVITDIINRIEFVNSYGLVISAVIITIVSIIGILIISKWARSGDEK